MREWQNCIWYQWELIPPHGFYRGDDIRERADWIRMLVIVFVQCCCVRNVSGILESLWLFSGWTSTRERQIATFFIVLLMRESHLLSFVIAVILDSRFVFQSGDWFRDSRFCIFFRKSPILYPLCFEGVISHELYPIALFVMTVNEVPRSEFAWLSAVFGRENLYLLVVMVRRIRLDCWYNGLFGNTSGIVSLWRYPRSLLGLFVTAVMRDLPGGFVRLSRNPGNTVCIVGWWVIRAKHSGFLVWS